VQSDNAAHAEPCRDGDSPATLRAKAAAYDAKANGTSDAADRMAFAHGARMCRLTADINDAPAWSVAAGIEARCTLFHDPIPDHSQDYFRDLKLAIAACMDAAAAKSPDPKVAKEVHTLTDRERDKIKREEERKAKPGASLGMTSAQVINETSWGRPEHVNSTVTAHGAHEQWVYPGYEFLYFEDGRLVAMQTKRD
jgi:hypothetical protein